MKAIHYIYTAMLLLLLASCNNTDIVLGNDASAPGRFMLSLLTEEVTTEDITRAGSFNPDVSKFMVSITDAKGLELVSGMEYGTMEDHDKVLPAAKDYLIEVANCTPQEAVSANEGWGTIRFMASQTFDIVSEETTPLVLECTMANAGLTVIFDESFTTKFPTYAATIQDARNLVFKSTTADKLAYYNISQDQENISLRLTGSAGGWNDRIDKTHHITLTKGKITRLRVKFNDGSNTDSDVDIDIDTDTSMGETDDEVTVG